MTVRSGRVAVVTGAGRGIGASAANHLAMAGAKVVLAARTAAEVEATAAGIRSQGGTALPMTCDVADPAAVDALAEATRAAFGPAEILVNNAAVLEPIGPLADIEPDAWSTALDINVTGAWLCLRAFLPAMVDAGWGRVVAVSSSSAAQAFPTLAAYCTGKAAFEHLHRVAAVECAGTGVLVNLLWPGGVDTAMQGQLRDGDFKYAEGSRAAYDDGRLRPPDAVAPEIVRLCGEELTDHGERVDLDLADDIGEEPVVEPAR